MTTYWGDPSPIGFRAGSWRAAPPAQRGSRAALSRSERAQRSSAAMPTCESSKQPFNYHFCTLEAYLVRVVHRLTCFTSFSFFLGDPSSIPRERHMYITFLCIFKRKRRDISPAARVSPSDGSSHGVYVSPRRRPQRARCAIKERGACVQNFLRLRRACAARCA